MSFSQAERSIDYGGIEINRHLAEAIELVTVGKMDIRQVLNQKVQESQEVLDRVKTAKK